MPRGWGKRRRAKSSTTFDSLELDCNHSGSMFSVAQPDDQHDRKDDRSHREWLGAVDSPLPIHEGPSGRVTDENEGTDSDTDSLRLSTAAHSAVTRRL